ERQPSFPHIGHPFLGVHRNVLRSHTRGKVWRNAMRPSSAFTDAVIGPRPGRRGSGPGPPGHVCHSGTEAGDVPVTARRVEYRGSTIALIWPVSALADAEPMSAHDESSARRGRTPIRLAGYAANDPAGAGEPPRKRGWPDPPIGRGARTPARAAPAGLC